MNELMLKTASKLVSVLTNLHIPHRCIPVCQIGLEVPGYKITFPWCAGDLVCHPYSYGGELGLWESMGMAGDDDDVTGYLTTENAVKKIIRTMAEKV